VHRSFNGANGVAGGSAADSVFRRAYASHRAREGRGPLDERSLLALPWLTEGPFAAEWSVRARSYQAFLDGVLVPLARRSSGPLRVLDLGAGNGWLCYRMTRLGHEAVAVDVRTDEVDGLGAARGYQPHLDRMFDRVAASFECLPFLKGEFDVAVFNASLHYAQELSSVLGEVTRCVRSGGRIAVLDSPFYPSPSDGEAMVADKRARAGSFFGDLADVLAAPRFIEYLTRERLEQASAASLGLAWQRTRVRYPLRYELRPWAARLLGRRTPSRFDVWWTEVR
jgi:SAM-dependent methyltransferase